MSDSCSNCVKYNYRSVCGDCGHRCCKDAHDLRNKGKGHNKHPKNKKKHSYKKKKHHKKDKCYDSDSCSSSSSSSSSSCSSSSSGSGSGCEDNYNSCGKGGNCCEDDCGDVCKTFRKVKRCKKKRVYYYDYKSKKSKLCLKEGFSANDITRIEHPSGDVVSLENGKALIRKKYCDDVKSTYVCHKDLYQVNNDDYDYYSVEMCGTKDRCGDVSLKFSSCYLADEDCGDVQYELYVTAVDNKKKHCDEKTEISKFCEGGERVFVKSACKPDGGNPYTLTWCKVPFGCDRTIFTFRRKGLNCEETRHGSEYKHEVCIENVCVYA